MKINRRQPVAIVLVAILWVLIMLEIMVFITAQLSNVDSRISMSTGDRFRSKWAARAGLEQVIATLMLDDTPSDSLYDVWSGYVADFNDIVLDDVAFSAEVTDEAGKLNINTITRAQLMELPDMTEEIADSILDWRDSDEDIREFGVESEYYVQLPNPYMARNGNFRTIRELLLVRGVTQALFYGKGVGEEFLSDYNEGWIKYLTCYSYDNNNDADGQTRTNINSASSQDLQDNLQISSQQANWIIQNRQYGTIVDLLEKSMVPQNNQNSNQNNQNNPQNQTQPLSSDDFYAIADKITTSNENTFVGRVNINTAPLNVLIALLEGDYTLAQDIVAYRESLADGIVSLADLANLESITLQKAKELANYVTTRSSVFTINVVATGMRTSAQYYVEAVVDRNISPTEMLYFREGASY